MSPIGWLLGLVLPACAAEGAAGLPVPPPMDLTHLVRPASPNNVLVAPPGSDAVPDIVAPTFSVSPARLYELVRSVATSQPHVWLAADYPERLQVHYVARSAVFNFPDLIAVQVLPVTDGSTLALYSRSVYGYSDFGANRRRALAWLAALQAAFNLARER